MRNNKYLDDSILIERIIDMVKKISERSGMNKKVVNDEYLLELRDCLVWCCGIISELISLPAGKFLIYFFFILRKINFFSFLTYLSFFLS